MSGLDASSARYLELLKATLTASLYDESGWSIPLPRWGPIKQVLKFLRRLSIIIVRERRFDPAARENGMDWPMFGFTMVGKKRLDNIEDCIASVVADGVPGDYVECGVWRGGSSMFARAALDLYGGQDRTVWLADSFAGMPARKEADMVDVNYVGTEYLAVSLQQVQSNFARFGLLDERVKFLKGWFSDTLKDAPIGPISILRLDGDYYSSTMDALDALYDRLSDRGYVIVDDYNAFVSCKAAITDFCNKRGLSPNLHKIDNTAVYWRREFCGLNRRRKTGRTD